MVLQCGRHRRWWPLARVYARVAIFKIAYCEAVAFRAWNLHDKGSNCLDVAGPVLARRFGHVTIRWKSRLSFAAFSPWRNGVKVKGIRGRSTRRWPRIVRRSFTLTDNCRRRIVVCVPKTIHASNERKKNRKIQVQRRLADKYWRCFSLEFENKKRCLPTVRCWGEMLKNEISVRSLTFDCWTWIHDIAGEIEQYSFNDSNQYVWIEALYYVTIFFLFVYSCHSNSYKHSITLNKSVKESL